MVIIKDLVKKYGNLTAVNQMSLDIHAGEIFGLLGPNGAGKTTTLSMIAGLKQLTSGSIVIDGKDAQKERSAIRSIIGVVPQELALYTTITARDNLVFFGGIYGLTGKHLKQRIQDVLAIVGLSERADDVVQKYSGGMKRRLNLACGLLHSPKLLLLDEPTVGVDPQSRNLIFENIQQLNQKDGMTIIYTTHYMEEAETLCHRVGIVDQGKLVALDTPRALINQHSGGVIEVKTNVMTEKLMQEIAAVSLVQAVTQVDGLIKIQALETYKAIVEIVALFKTRGIALESLHIEEAGLENVFLKLTGKSLRDSGKEQDLQQGEIKA